MESVDMKKLETAIVYLQRISDGNNPINNLPADEDSILNNPNVIRCMFFVKEILEEVKRNDGYIGKQSKAKKTKKNDFPFEVLSSFSYQEDKPISRFVEQINKSVDGNIYKKVNYKTITQWLKLNCFLQEEYSQEFENTITLATEKGTQIGIRSERRTSSSGREYIVVIYGKQAQEYIVNNMEKIIYGECAE